ncbi:histidine kinase, partial [Vibrio splendidus]|uniref:sensor histidine kinase n=1 Tax=Vibrio splendidus TaxID=29497 RepID=UPI00280C1678
DDVRHGLLGASLVSVLNLAWEFHGSVVYQRQSLGYSQPDSMLKPVYLEEQGEAYQALAGLTWANDTGHNVVLEYWFDSRAWSHSEWQSAIESAESLSVNATAASLAGSYDQGYQFDVGISMVIAMTFGTLNAHYWLNGYFGANISDLKSVVLLGVIFCSVCYYYFYTREQQLRADNELEVAKRRQADQEKVVVLSQLKQLQSQIEPHFLFNTLATINVLIESDSAKAKLMLEKLTDLLRVTLKNSRTEQSTIAQEVDLLDAYLNIQKIRRGNQRCLMSGSQW